MLLGLSLTLLGLLAAPEELAWPLDLPRELTSSFGEYRPGRFHAGIDLRTGEIGKPVRAAGDGHVSRIRCSPYGYGKAVYLQLDSGMTMVYGHLDDYRDDLRAYVRDAQHSARQYTVDLSPAPGQFRVKRGEIIAKSGDTGIGVPHLHWEIRGVDGRLINPRRLGISWPDQTRPILRGLLAIPQDPESTINGDVVPQKLPLKDLGNGTYTTDPVAVVGNFTFAVDVIDPVTGGAKLGIYSAETRLGDEIGFALHNDYLDYDTNESGKVAFYPYSPGGGPFLSLWRWPGNNAPSFASSPGTGWLAAPATPGEATITLADFLGNTATLRIPLTPGRPDIPTPTAANGGAGRAWLDACEQYAVISARFEQPEATAPRAFLTRDGAKTEIAVLRAGGRTFRAPFNISHGQQATLTLEHPRIPPFTREIYAYRAGEAQKPASSGGFTLTPAKDSPFGVLYLSIADAPTPPRDPIRRLGPAWHVWPDDAPIAAPVQISLPMPDGAEDPARVAIYRNRGGGWTALTTKRQDGRLTAQTDRFGVFAVLEDTLPPVIANLSPDAKTPITSRRPHIRATISDIGSGIAAYDVTCGDQWLLTAYDPEKSTLEWERDKDLPTGQQTLRIQVRDTAGNQHTLERLLNIP